MSKAALPSCKSDWKLLLILLTGLQRRKISMFCDEPPFFSLRLVEGRLPSSAPLPMALSY